MQQCLDALQPCPTPGADELADLLTRYELEGLLSAHDALAKRLPGPPTPAVATLATPDASLQPPASEAASQYVDEQIRMVKIEKTNEPLVRYLYFLTKPAY